MKRKEDFSEETVKFIEKNEDFLLGTLIIESVVDALPANIPVEKVFCGIARLTALFLKTLIKRNVTALPFKNEDIYEAYKDVIEYYLSKKIK